MLACLGASDAHGFMSQPAARQALAWDDNKFFCPHCLAAGGTGTVQQLLPSFPSASPEDPSTAFRHGLCGDNLLDDPAERWLQPNPTVLSGEYTEGQGIEIWLDITANHKGYHEFYLCDTPSEMLESSAKGQACLNRHRLTRAALGPANTMINPADPYRWYMPGSTFGTDASDGPPLDAQGWYGADNFAPDNLGRSPSKGQYPSSQRFKMKYYLPEGVSCDHCVLQWYWRTANSCNPRGYESGGFVRNVINRQDWANGANMASCGGEAYAEEFFNCADVRIRPSDGSGDGGGGGAQPVPTPTPSTPVPPTPAPTPPAQPAPVPVPVPEPEPEPQPEPESCQDGNSGSVRIAKWEQCGGASMSMPPSQTQTQTCCEVGTSCVYVNVWYSQCKPGPPAPTPAPPAPAPVPTPASGQNGQCQSLWAKCAGIGFTGTRACCTSRGSWDGAQLQEAECVHVNDWYSQCKPKSTMRNRERNLSLSLTSPSAKMADLTLSAKAKEQLQFVAEERLEQRPPQQHVKGGTNENRNLRGDPRR